MAGEIPANNSSQYDGKKGKTNVIMQGQTDSGSFGSAIDVKRRTESPPKDVTV